MICLRKIGLLPRLWALFLLSLGFLWLMAPEARAVSGTWTNTVSGTWTVASSWAGNVIAGGAGFTANLTSNIGAARTVTIDGAVASQTIGILNIGDSASTFSAFTLAGVNAGTLTLDNSGTNAQINETLTSAGDTVSIPLLLNSSIDLNNTGTSGGKLTLSGAITPNAAGVKTISNLSTGNGPITISGIISDGASQASVVQDSASSSLTLSGTNTFTGGVSILAGTLLAGNVSALGASNNVVTLGAASGTANASLFGTVSGTYSQAINVAGGSSNNVFTIGGNGTSTTPVFSGSIQLMNHDLLLANNATTNGAFMVTGGISGTGNITAVNTGTSGALTISTTGINTVGGLTLNAQNRGAISVSAPVNITGTVTNSGTGTGTVTISGNISSAAGVLQNSGSSTLILSASNSYVGGISVLSGTLQLGNISALGANTNVVTLGASSGTASATLTSTASGTVSQSINVAGGSSNNVFSIGGNGTTSATPNYSGSIQLMNHDLLLANRSTSTGGLTFSGGFSGTGNLTASNSGSSGLLTISGPVNTVGTITNSGTGLGDTTISGNIGANVTGITQNSLTSALTLSGTNTAYANGIAITSGVLNSGAFGLGASTNVITLGAASGTSDATLSANTTATFAQSINVAGGSSGNTLTIGNIGGTSGDPTYSGSLTLQNHDLTLANSTTGNATPVFSGAISGTGNITTLNNSAGTSAGLTISSSSINHVGSITNSGTGARQVTISGIIGSNVTGIVQNSPTSQLIMTGNNTAYSHGVTILSGTVSATTSANALGTGTATLGNTSGSADATLLGDQHTFANAINVRSGNSGLMTLGNTASTAAVFSGLITLNKDLVVSASGTGSVNLSGAATGAALTGTANLTVNSATPASNFVSLGGNNSGFTGNILVNSGTFRVTSATALSFRNTVAVGAGVNSVFNLNNNSQTIAGLNDGTGGGLVTNSGASAQILTLAGGGSYSFSGSLAAATPSNLAVTHTGTGTQTLTGDSTYTGATNLSAGTFIVGVAGAGSLGNTAVAVGANATLGGSGTIGGAVTVSGTLAPGNSPGTLTITNSLILNSTAQVLMELGGASSSQYDRVIGLTNLTLDGTITVSLVSFTPAWGDTFDLFDWSGTLNASGFTLSDLILPTLGGGNTWDTSNFLTNGSITVVPEPSTATLAGAGLAGILYLFRRAARQRFH